MTDCDWLDWHRGYDDPTSSLSKRLRVVQDFAAEALEYLAPGPARVLSLCAGDGRDIIPVLAASDRVNEITTVLVEQHPVLVEAARQRASHEALLHLEVRQGDAGDPQSFIDITPVDLLMVCGIFGNIDSDDLATTIAALPALLAPQGQVIWTRGNGERDLRPHVRSLFADAGFDEQRYDGAPAEHGVGLARLTARDAHRQQPLPSRLFTFVR